MLINNIWLYICFFFISDNECYIRKMIYIVLFLLIECGVVFISKLEGMFKDMECFKDFNLFFK